MVRNMKAFPTNQVEPNDQIGGGWSVQDCGKSCEQQKNSQAFSANMMRNMKRNPTNQVKPNDQIGGGE